MPEPFNIAVPDERLHSIRARLEAFDWSALPDAGGWESGVGIADLRRLVDYWLRRYDWRVQEARLNRLAQFTAEVQGRSEEHTSELQSLMRISYAVFCLKKKKNDETIDYRQRLSTNQ